MGKKDITTWNSAQLTAAILRSKSNTLSVCKMILHAEDTHFTVEESAQLSPWLLNFAEKHKTAFNGNGYGGSQDAVWSAIRTGASMLTPNDAKNLCTLLQPGQSTSLTAMKMLGRIFEAQPPTDIDQHIDLANDVLNQHIIDTQSTFEISYTILAIYAIVAMGCDLTERIIEILKKYEAWTTKRLYRKLVELRDAWWKKGSVSENIMELLGQTIGDIYLVIENR